MGLRVAAVIVSTSFLLGILFTHWIADSRTLWQATFTEADIRAAAAYYSIFASLPVSMAWVMIGIASIGAAALWASLNDGNTGNIMFDGASLFLYGCTFAVYGWSVVPSLNEVFKKPFIPSNSVEVPLSESVKQPTIDLASSHLVCSVALTGVLVLQAGRWWAEGEEKFEAEEEERNYRRSLRLDSSPRRRRTVESDTEEDHSVPTTRSNGLRKSISSRRNKEERNGKIPPTSSRYRKLS
ncbi:hypothetical protein FRC02_010806 [Tulasnella sp. 418]|nr:hypothetical protein FRC02_010806 [Tulasnella sp. 418]